MFNRVAEALDSNATSSWLLAVFVWCASLATGCAPVSQTYAQDHPNIMVFGEDIDVDTVPRHSRVFDRVIVELQKQLHDAGFTVAVEEVATLDDAEQHRSHRAIDEITDIARGSTRPPIDVAVVFEIFATADELQYTTKPKIRIAARMFNVHNGRFIDAFEVESLPDLRLPKDCDRSCLLEGVGKSARRLATDLGSVLARQLERNWSGVETSGRVASVSGGSNSGEPEAFSFVFEKICDADVANDMESYIAAFSGYDHHRVVRETNCHREYWYETYSDRSRLIKNTRRMVQNLGVDAEIRFSGAVITVEKF